MNDFLKAKSMLTPGAAGAMVTLFTATLSSQFHAPPNWTSLTLSFLCGLVVLGDDTVKGLMRLVLYFINSLVIFAAAIGANGVGMVASAPAAAPTVSVAATSPTPAARGTPAHRVTAPVQRLAVEEKRFFHPWFQGVSPIESAHVLSVTPREQ